VHSISFVQKAARILCSSTLLTESCPDIRSKHYSKTAYWYTHIHPSQDRYADETVYLLYRMQAIYLVNKLKKKIDHLVRYAVRIGCNFWIIYSSCSVHGTHAWSVSSFRTHSSPGKGRQKGTILLSVKMALGKGPWKHALLTVWDSPDAVTNDCFNN
jgi:hypothetical protein